MWWQRRVDDDRHNHFSPRQRVSPREESASPRSDYSSDHHLEPDRSRRISRSGSESPREQRAQQAHGTVPVPDDRHRQREEYHRWHEQNGHVWSADGWRRAEQLQLPLHDERHQEILDELNEELANAVMDQTRLAQLLDELTATSPGNEYDVEDETEEEAAAAEEEEGLLEEGEEVEEPQPVCVCS